MRLLEPEDRALFREYADRFGGEYDFEYSWGYIAQAMRKGGWAFDHDGLILVGIDRWIVPAITADSELIAHLALAFYDTGRKMRLKNVDPPRVPEFEQHGFRECEPEEYWNAEAPFDDQTFPQRVVSIDDVLERRGHRFAGLRRGLHRCQVDKIVTVSYEREHKRDVYRLVWQMNKRIPGFSDAHTMYLETEFDSHVFLHDGEVVGMATLDRISDSCAAFNCLIYDPHYRLLSDLLTVETMRIAQDRGYRYVNFQGSETASLDRWKLKYRPVISLEKKHLIFDPHYSR